MVFKKVKVVVLAMAICMLGTNVSQAKKLSMQNAMGEKDVSLMVAHAGGAIHGFKYTNSLQALENSYKNGFRYMEMDFNWTSDGVPVAIHDWDAMVRRLYGVEPKVMSHSEFKGTKTFQNLTMMDIGDVANWLAHKPDPFIITDIKDDNIGILKYISENYPAVKPRFIPQIYSLDEYEAVKALGYDKIILTLYKSVHTEEEIVQFATTHKLYGVTMHHENAYSDLPKRLKELGLRVYIHTVNDLHIYETLYNNGVRGIYTDYFELNNFPYMY